MTEQIVKDLRKALQDATDALAQFVDTDARYKLPYEHPSSVYDRAVDTLRKYPEPPPVIDYSKESK